MEGHIDTTFGTFQRDLFASGLAAGVGPNALAIWGAIKSHASFQTGRAWPSIRLLSTETGLNTKTVMKGIHVLVAANLLRIDKPGNRGASTRYIARERLDVRLGGRPICRVVVDYIPAQIRKKLNGLNHSLQAGEHNPEAFAQVDIIPGPGFVWDEAAGLLRSQIPAKELPAPEAVDAEEFAASVLGLKVAGIREKATRPRLPKP